jgi:hypothetical protein
VHLRASAVAFVLFRSHPSDDGNYALTVGSGGIFRSIAAIIGEVTTQYVLRYVPDTGAADAKQFRKIRIVVPELPTAKVRFRTGYYPFAP